VSSFVDESGLHVKGGNGGAGAVSFRREAHTPKGGPDGGDGGDGGDVWLVADRNVPSLLAFKDHPFRRAGDGVHGTSKKAHGKRGGTIEVPVPEGTIVKDQDGTVPAHQPHCLGCGPDNPHGHHLQVRRYGDGVVAEHTFDNRHVGAPGIAHGGAVATVLDDLFGFVLYVVGDLAVTRHLEVGYRAPVLLGVPYLLEAGLDRREGRKLFVSARGVDEDGALVVEAQAVFIVVELQHFSRGSRR